MRKITAAFNSIAKVQKFKKIIRKVYSGNNDNIPEIANFNLNKILIPNHVVRAELEIIKLIGGNGSVTVPKTSLTFLVGDRHPYTKIFGDLDEAGKYIVLSWNIGSPGGLDGLRLLIDQIPLTTKGIKYTIYIENEAGSTSEVRGFAELSLSRSHAPDQAEQLLEQVHRLELRLNPKQEAALISFVFNCGSGAFQASALRQKLARREYELAADEFLKWVYSGGLKLKGLIKRRLIEKNLFLSGTCN